MLKVPVTANDHIQGNENALITLVEFGDYQCPYCGKAYPIIKKVQAHFGDKLRFVFRNMPMSKIHPMAIPSADAAEFAEGYDKFWQMHDLIYENQKLLSLELLVELGKTLDLPVAELFSAIESQAFSEKIQADFMGGIKSGVNGTPTFFINGERFNGPPEVLISTIEAGLKVLH